ncbi:hypothetical protein Y032_0048g1676 [Ancylostoma ceylanicum]|uniref:Uncharacterized protein n=1 Tax=Ancylostoma ceylanicum TaxID=53326 RepID=A0A016UC87_9BILA|nr:hypothetical protein Y032_0048g1676 [Ancylostoma ceylanicum]
MLTFRYRVKRLLRTLEDRTRHVLARHRTKVEKIDKISKSIPSPKMVAIFQLSRRPAYELESSRKRRNQWYESTSQYITYGMVHDWNNLLRMLAPASGKSLTKNVTENFETTSSIAKPHTACGEH